MASSSTSFPSRSGARIKTLKDETSSPGFSRLPFSKSLRKSSIRCLSFPSYSIMYCNAKKGKKILLLLLTTPGASFSKYNVSAGCPSHFQVCNRSEREEKCRHFFLLLLCYRTIWKVSSYWIPSKSSLWKKKTSSALELPIVFGFRSSSQDPKLACIFPIHPALFLGFSQPFFFSFCILWSPGYLGTFSIRITIDRIRSSRVHCQWEAHNDFLWTITFV